MAAVEEQASVLSDEELDVLRWRRQMFLDLGFTVRQSRRLAEIAADWHRAEALLVAGCPTDTAFDLLS